MEFVRYSLSHSPSLSPSVWLIINLHYFKQRNIFLFTGTDRILFDI